MVVKQKITTPASGFDEDDYDVDDILSCESKMHIYPKNHKDKKQILRFKDYSKLCEDFMGCTKFKLVNYDDVLKLTLKTIEQEAGSLKTDDIYEVAKQDKSKEGMNKSSMILEYISAIGFEQIKRAGELKITKIKNFNNIPQVLIDKGIGTISNQIAEDAVKMINQKSKTENEEIK